MGTTHDMIEIFCGLAFLVTMLVGWIEWFRDPYQSGIFPKSSFIGMSLTSATFVGLIAFAIYAEAFGVRFSVHYELLIRIYKSLAPLCVLGFLSDSLEYGVEVRCVGMPQRALSLLHVSG